MLLTPLPNEVLMIICRIAGAKCRVKLCMVSKNWGCMALETSIACSTVSNARKYYEKKEKCDPTDLHKDYHLWKRSGGFLNITYSVLFGDIDILIEMDKFARVFDHSVVVQNHINSFLYEAVSNPTAVDYLLAKLEKIPNYAKYKYNMCFLRACEVGSAYTAKILADKFIVDVDEGFILACKTGQDLEFVKHLWKNRREDLSEDIQHDKYLIDIVSKYKYKNADLEEFVKSLV